MHSPCAQDFKANPDGAQPYATISMYKDLVESKGLGLVRADITPNLSKKVSGGVKPYAGVVVKMFQAPGGTCLMRLGFVSPSWFSVFSAAFPKLSA